MASDGPFIAYRSRRSGASTLRPRRPIRYDATRNANTEDNTTGSRDAMIRRLMPHAAEMAANTPLLPPIIIYQQQNFWANFTRKRHLRLALL